MAVDVRQCYERHIKCPKCGKVMTMWSKNRTRRKIGHVKTMNCYFCGKLVDGIEVREERGEDE